MRISDWSSDVCSSDLLTVAQGWQWVAHAVALHEHRWTFPLTLALDADGHNVVEAPFIGAHADIGGGSLQAPDAQPDTRGHLADVALNWILWQASESLAGFDPFPAFHLSIPQHTLHQPPPDLLPTS